ncbi:MAG: hypothetical protein R3B09_34475 [Nannocystaceae bacterium]
MRRNATELDRLEDVSRATASGSWSSRLLSSLVALTLVSAPTQALAWAPPQNQTQPTQTQTQGTVTTSPTPSPAPTSTPTPAPTPTPEGAPPTGADGTPDEPPTEPIEAPEQPEPPATPEPPAPEPEPAPEATPAPTPPAVGPTPPPTPEPTVKDIEKAQKLRKGGIYTMATGGGVALIGLGMMVGYTIQGRRIGEDLLGIQENISRKDCAYKSSSECDALKASAADTQSRKDNANLTGQVSGAIFGAGLLVVALGGVAYRQGIKKMKRVDFARVRVTPTWGGAMITGRF